MWERKRMAIRFLHCMNNVVAELFCCLFFEFWWKRSQIFLLLTCHFSSCFFFGDRNFTCIICTYDCQVLHFIYFVWKSLRNIQNDCLCLWSFLQFFFLSCILLFCIIYSLYSLKAMTKVRHFTQWKWNV